MENSKSKRVLCIIIVAIILVAAVIIFFMTQANSGSGEASFVTYEFETYDGDEVVIDESNIILQEKTSTPEESSDISSEAEIVAPGRDYVYMADDSFYYIADYENNLLTIATK